MPKNKPNKDNDHMQQCLELADKQSGKTFPNPLVGSVIVKNNKVIAIGAYKGPGTPHAEAVALKKAGKQADGATLYVNLEPCSHFGENPPCTNAIIEAKIQKVVYAVKDPNPVVKKNAGHNILKKAGIQVEYGLLAGPARTLNEIFLKYFETGKPFVTLKLAASLDGRIATKTGDSKWITGASAREFVQQLRGNCDSIMAGVNTIINDNPSLTGRSNKKGNQPYRIIFDSTLKIPLKAKVLTDKFKKRTIIITTNKRDQQKFQKLKKMKINTMTTVMDSSGRINFKKALEQVISSFGLRSILIEGGGELAASALKAKVIDKLYYFIAPKIIGGRDAIPSIGGNGIEKLSDACSLKDVSYRTFGKDILVEGYLN
jgi:diaminohydroxyphosphoribosylaminopyrimidine deaminase / 5-amino-6-(5-phosphoribosylamino)uracil reductase